jgi:GDP-L-fucose synthase
MNAERLKGHRALVLGGHGFVGQHLVTGLQSAGVETHVHSRKTGVDARHFDALVDMIRQVSPDVVFNMAAHVGSLHHVSTFAADVVHDNALIALNLYRAVQVAAPGATIVNPLSNCSYPGDATIQRESEWWDGPVHDSVWSYGNAKKFIYVLSRCYAKQYGIRSANFLVPNAFGPGDYTDPNKTHALNGLIIRMLEAQRREDQEFIIWGSGAPIREWGYVKDVAAVLVQSLSLSIDLLEPLNIAQGCGYSIRESAEIVQSAVGFEGRFVFDTSKQDGAPRKVLDDGRFRRVFADFQFTDHAHGVAETVDYYRSVL